jgi:uncharacterized protein (DUF1015 family)
MIGLRNGIDRGRTSMDRQQNGIVIGRTSMDRQQNGIVIGRTSMDRQQNGKKKKYKRTNNDLQHTTPNTKDRATRIPIKTRGVVL